MKFNLIHKNLPGFKAIKWLIEKSSINIESYENEFPYGKIKYVGKKFSGNIPMRMYHDILDLRTLGYQDKESIDPKVYISWETDNETHIITVTTHNFKRGYINFVYNKYRYCDMTLQQVKAIG